MRPLASSAGLRRTRLSVLIARALLAFAALHSGSTLSAIAAPPSNSKLSIHLIGPYTSGAQAVINAHPRVLKIFFSCSCVSGAQLQAARDYKTGTPAGKVVLRIYSTQHFNISDDPTNSANSFYNVTLAPALNNMSAADKALIDYLEGPNEVDSTPTFETIAAAHWFNNFWMQLATLISNAGFHPMFGSIAVGNPGGDTNNIHACMDAIVPALRRCQSLGGGWSYHDYASPTMTKDLGVEIYYSLRYRQYYGYFATNYPDLANIPMVATEGGGFSGWTMFGAAYFEDWLAWHDTQIQQDSYLIGDTLFEIGDPSGWGTFDVEPIAGWLANHIASAVQPQPPAPPTALVATPGNTQISLSWIASSGATSYNVKRSTTSGGPYATIAPGLTATGYTNTGLTNGTTYYYVVTAQNSLGESGASNQAAAMPSNAVPTNNEDFEIMPGWASAFDASWGSAATWSVVAGGQSAMALQATRSSQGSSGKVLLYNISSSTNYTISVYMKCPSYSANTYFAQCAYKLGNNSASDFDANYVTWAYLQDFRNTGTNGNGNTWLQYSLMFNSGNSNQISVGFKLGSQNGPAPTVLWDSLRIVGPPVTPTIALSPASLSTSCNPGINASGQTFTVRNSGTGTLSYSIGVNAAWLGVSPSGGTSTGETDTITVTYTTAALAIGSYNATITVTDTQAANSPQTIPVMLAVHVPGDLNADGSVDPMDLALWLGCQTGPDLGPPVVGCTDADIDHDLDVDQSDFATLQKCFSGTNVPANPLCAS